MVVFWYDMQNEGDVVEVTSSSQRYSYESPASSSNARRDWTLSGRVVYIHAQSRPALLLVEPALIEHRTYPHLDERPKSSSLQPQQVRRSRNNTGYMYKHILSALFRQHGSKSTYFGSNNLLLRHHKLYIFWQVHESVLQNPSFIEENIPLLKAMGLKVSLSKVHLLDISIIKIAIKDVRHAKVRFSHFPSLILGGALPSELDKPRLTYRETVIAARISECRVDVRSTKHCWFSVISAALQ